MSKLLLLGEGDFSFTQAILKLQKKGQNWPDLIGLKCVAEIVSSSLDSRAEVLSKYPCFGDKVLPVLHCVNGIDPEVYRTIGPSAVLWNHPHLGTEDAQLHVQLMRHFFHTMQISSISEIVLSFIPGQFERWGVENAANKFGFALASRKTFLEAEFPGYASRRNLSGSSFKSTHSQVHWERGDESRSMHSTFFLFVPDNTIDTTLTKESEVINKIVFSCAICPKQFRTMQGVTTHCSQVHERMAPPVVQTKLLPASSEPIAKETWIQPEQSEMLCRICDAIVGPDHVSRFGRNDVVSFPCQTCGKEFREQRAMVQHIQMKHLLNG